MNYEKIGFIKGQLLKAEHMNHIEDGIAQVENDTKNTIDILRNNTENAINTMATEIENAFNTLINDEGVGYVERGAEIIMPETTISMYLSNPDNPESSHYYYNIGNWDFSIFSSSRPGIIYINNEKYKIYYIKGSLQFGPDPWPGHEGAFSLAEQGMQTAGDFNLSWNRHYSDSETPPETILVRIEHPYETIHKINNNFLDAELTALPQRVSLLESEGILVEKGQYSFEEGEVSFTIPAPISIGQTLKVHFDGVDYECLVQAVSLSPGTPTLYFGNLKVLSPAINLPTTSEPFFGLAPVGINLLVLGAQDTNTHTVEISINNPIEVNRLPNGGFGYSETNAFNFGGIITEEIINTGCVKLSSEPMDLNSISKVYVDLHPELAAQIGMSKIEISPGTCVIENTDFGQILSWQEMPVLVSVVTPADDYPDIGLFGICSFEQDEDEYVAVIWVSKVEYGEIIHRIDPKYLPEGGFGYDEIKEEEILPPTECPRITEEGEYNGSYYSSGSYAIPDLHLERDGDHKKYKYYLYVDGKEFIYDYSPKLGSGWSQTDSTDNRFNSTYESIYPDQIEPTPETVIASIKKVWTEIHSINDKYIHDLPARVNLLETGGRLLDKITLPFEVDADLGAGVFQTYDSDVIEYLKFIKPGMQVNIQVDGIDYQSEVLEEDNVKIIGNADMLMGKYIEGDIPIVCYFNDVIVMIGVIGTQETHTISIAINTSIPNYIKENKFLCCAYLEPEYISGPPTTMAEDVKYIPLIVGNNYLVITDSGTYIAECKSHFGFRQYLGNATLATSLSGTIDTGESFCVVAELGSDTRIYDANGGTTCTVIALGGGQSIINPNQLVKTIDLDKYGIGETIISLIENQGGSEPMGKSMADFWSDISTNSVLRLKMQVQGMDLVIDQCAQFNTEGQAIQLMYNFMVADGAELNSNLLMIHVAIVRTSGANDSMPGAIVHVKVT